MFPVFIFGAFRATGQFEALFRVPDYSELGIRGGASLYTYENPVAPESLLWHDGGGNNEIARVCLFKMGDRETPHGAECLGPGTVRRRSRAGA